MLYNSNYAFVQEIAFVKNLKWAILPIQVVKYQKSLPVLKQNVTEIIRAI